MLNKFIAWIIVAVCIVLIVIGAYYATWCLWCWVLPIFWESGPKNIIRPQFWPFAGMWFLVSLIGRKIFGGGSKK